MSAASPKDPQPVSTTGHPDPSQPDPEPVAKVQAGSGEAGVSSALGQGDIAASAQTASPIAAAIASAGQDQPSPAAPSQTSTPNPSPLPSAHEAQAANAPALITPHVVQSVQQSEIRVGVQPEGLGPIEIRAVMRGEELGAAISAQQPDTRQWLVSHLGELAHNLDSQNVRVSQLSVGSPSGSGSLSSDFAQSGTRDQAGQQQTLARFGYDESKADTSSETDLIGETYGITEARTGVDLRA